MAQKLMKLLEEVKDETWPAVALAWPSCSNPVARTEESRTTNDESACQGNDRRAIRFVNVPREVWRSVELLPLAAAVLPPVLELTDEVEDPDAELELLEPELFELELLEPELFELELLEPELLPDAADTAVAVAAGVTVVVKVIVTVARLATLYKKNMKRVSQSKYSLGAGIERVPWNRNMKILLRCSFRLRQQRTQPCSSRSEAPPGQ